MSYHPAVVAQQLDPWRLAMQLLALSDHTGGQLYAWPSAIHQYERYHKSPKQDSSFLTWRARAHSFRYNRYFIRDIRYLIFGFDFWRSIFDIWYSIFSLIFDLWYLVFDFLYFTFDIRYAIIVVAIQYSAFDMLYLYFIFYTWF